MLLSQFWHGFDRISFFQGISRQNQKIQNFPGGLTIQNQRLLHLVIRLGLDRHQVLNQIWLRHIRKVEFQIGFKMCIRFFLFHLIKIISLKLQKSHSKNFQSFRVCQWLLNRTLIWDLIRSVFPLPSSTQITLISPTVTYAKKDSKLPYRPSKNHRKPGNELKHSIFILLIYIFI